MPNNRLRDPAQIRRVFLTVMLLLASTLGLLGWRLITDDDALSEKLMDDQREATAGRALIALERGIGAVERDLEQMLAEGGHGLMRNPPAGAVYVEMRKDAVRVWPEGRLAYYPKLPEPAELRHGTFAGADELELKGDHAGAIAVHKEFATSADLLIRSLLVTNYAPQKLELVDLDRLSLLLKPATANGQRPSTPACNQPAREAIVHVAVRDRPVDLVSTRDGCWVFVSAQRAGGGGIAVFRRNGGAIDPIRFATVEGSPFGILLTRDERLLVAAAGTRVAVMDVERLISGEENPVLGYLRDSTFAGAIMVNVTSDDRYLFVSQEGAEAISVIDLEKARSSGFSNSAMIGSIPTGRAPIALVFSPDERYLYVTSQEAPRSYGWPIDCRPQVNRADPPDHTQGAILVIDVARAKTAPASSVAGLIRAGCNPVRLALSPDGRTAYVTARTDDMLLAFDTQRILSDPAKALIGRVPVGTAPVGVAVANGGQRIVVANSNRFGGMLDGDQNVTIIDAGRIAAGPAAIVGTIPAGTFPRQLHVTADGKTVLLTNFTSGTLQIMDLDRAVPGR